VRQGAVINPRRSWLVAVVCGAAACTAGEASVSVASLDTTDCPPGSNLIEGTPGPDTLVGTAGPDCIFGYGGDDSIDGRQGDDFIVGGDGSDTLMGGNGADQLFGDDGDDTIAGGTGPDTIEGGDGNDVISGDNGPDTVSGGDGHDVILDSRGPSTVDPGAGTDSCSGPRCELPSATRCLTTADCGAGQSCIGGACLYCLADASCSDSLVCTGAEECVPVTGCIDVPDLPLGFDLGLDCAAGLGACRRFGPLQCDGLGGQVCAAVPGLPTPDTDCDGIDDDCDGAADEGYISTGTSCGVGACRRAGLTSCSAGVVVDSCAPGSPSAETCDGSDEDCDGVVDEGLPDDDGDTLCTRMDACPFHPDPTVTAGPGDVIVSGVMRVELSDQTPTAPVPPATAFLTSLQVLAPAFGGRVRTDCRGVYQYVVPAGFVSPTRTDVAWAFQDDVPGPGGISSEMVVVDSFGEGWGTVFGHTDFFRTVGVTEGVDAMGRRTLTVDPITIATSEAELYRIGVLVIEDYHRIRGQPVPSDRLVYMRHNLVLFELVPFVPYAHVEMTSTVLDLNIMDTPVEREVILFHESGHVFRNLLDGGRSHWDLDNLRFTYLACHTGFGIFSEGYSFAEGWATYWQRARRPFAVQLGTPLAVGTPVPPNPLPGVPATRLPGSTCGVPGTASREWTERDRMVVTDAAMDPWACPVSVTDFCDATAGPRGIPLTPDHADWVEQMIADRIFALADTGCAGATTYEADATMMRVLEENPGTIHSLYEFERALCEAQIACCTFTRTTPPEICPPDYEDRGLTCTGPTEHSIGHLLR
jgi:hypothetical protein